MRHGTGSFGKKVYPGTPTLPLNNPVEPARTSRYDPSSSGRPTSGRSRYNPESEEPDGKSRYSGSRYNNSRQTRPRSMEMDASYHYSNGQANVVTSNSASGYYSRSNKWRSHSGSKSDYDNYNSLRAPFWKTQRSKFTAASPVLAPVSRPNRYNNSIPTTVQSKESSEESESLSESGKNSNPNSLGSSLINSVTQTTRSVERQHAVDHKRIHLEKPVSVRTPEEEQPKMAVDEEPVDEKIDLKKSDGLWDTFENEDRDETTKEEITQEKPIFHAEKSEVYDDYEFIYDPKLSKNNIQELSRYEPIVNYSIPIKPIDKCIFPLTRAETRLWELKNQPREEIIRDQRYLLKNPIRSVKSYPFIKQNILIHRQAVRPLLCRHLSTLKRFEYGKKLTLKKQFLELQSTWESKCHQMDEMSKEMRKEELEIKRKEELEKQERERHERENSELQARFSGSSRRRNRADFVDDTEIENVLLQIDPDYKHHQQAAEIPPMVLDPVNRYTMKFKNVNNLVTDKNAWASRILKDGIDTFTQDEHELFVEGYLTYPKKFGKISQFMGALRSPEDCVMHYYKTKSSVDYKKLLNDRNKKRQKGAIAKRRKKKERSGETENGVPSYSESENVGEMDEDSEKATTIGEEHAEEKPPKQMQQVEIKVPEKDNVVNEKQSGTATTEAVAQSIQEDDMVVDEQLHKPLPEKMEIETVIAQKRPHEALEAASDAEKTIVEENGLSAQTAQPECIVDQMHSESATVDGTNVEIHQGGAMHDEHMHKKRQKSNGDHKSSYWSVKEANLFPELLKQFGSQWSLISDKLGTKSTTMVRNYYQRNAAQLGWKSVVEEADFKRNATSSGSVQQSQILIQAEQNSIPITNGIPPQQRPALGFFSNQVASEKRLPYDVSTPPQPFIPDLNKDSFSQASTPNKILPPPRLPSIQLPGTTGTETLKPEPLANRSSIPSGSPMDNLLSRNEKPVGVSSSTINILNNHDRKEPFSPTYPPTQPPHFSHLQQSQQLSAVRPKIGNLMVQELQTSSSSSPSDRRSSSISLLLNPESQNPIQPAAANATPATPGNAPVIYPSVPQPSRENFNFAMDPLGALAAIASESLLPTKGAQATNNHDNKS